MSEILYEKIFSKVRFVIEKTDKFYVVSVITAIITFIIGIGASNDWQNGGRGITFGYTTLDIGSLGGTICYGIGYDNNLPLSILPKTFSHDSGYDFACCGIFISYIKNDESVL